MATFEAANTTNIGALSKDPANKNFLSPLGFKFQIRRLPHVNWFLQTVSLPGISLGEAIVSTPFIDTYQPGEKLTYDPLTITFKVDEDLKNWTELQEWLIGLGSPNTFEEYRKNLTRKGTEAIFSDGSLTILDSYMNSNFEVTFKEMFPTSLGELQFDSTQADVDHLTATASFRYLSYSFKKI